MQPKDGDVVLSGQQNPFANKVTKLQGIEGLKSRLANANSEQKIAVLSEALNYGDEGLKLVIQALKDTSGQVKQAAFQILRQQTANLEQLMHEHILERLTITRLAFWNAGNETIDKKDIASADPIRMVLKPGYNILDVKVIYENNKVNLFNFNFQSGNSEIILNFDYLDKHDGAILQIVHTGEDSKNFDIYGTVKSVGKPRLMPNEISSKINYEVIFSVFGAVAALISSALSALVSITNNLLVLWLINGIYIIIIGGAIFIIIWQANNFIFKRIPKEFNIFKDESWQF